MRVIDPGHKFALPHLDGDGEEIITYVKREGPGYPGNVGHYPGTNLQEGFRAEIARVKYLDQQDRCVENKLILNNLRDCIRLLEERAARRHGRRPDWRLYEKNGLETNDAIEFLPYCLKCGHIGCKGDCKR